MTEILIKDPYFDVQVLSRTERPNLLCYLAMHQDYSENDVWQEREKLSNLSEAELGDRIVRNCINPKHFGILEHASITFNVIGYPHSVMVQARTHRVGISFDVQSQRYTGERIYKLGATLHNLYMPQPVNSNNNLVEKYFYFRPVGIYNSRHGRKLNYTESSRNKDISNIKLAIIHYHNNINEDYPEEYAREMLLQNIRQHFVVTFNARSLLHFCDLRTTKDAQLEIRDLAYRLFGHFKEWMPEVAEVYEKKRLGKNLLAP